jgi:uncharacterized protein YkwD
MTRRTTALALIVSLVTIALQASDLDRLAQDLERVLGKGRVEVRTESEPHRVSSRSVTEVVEAMNRERSARGLGPLRFSESLSLAAQDRIADMFDQNYFAHVAPDGTQPFVWISRRGYSYRMAGENLAVGYGTAFSVVDGWMHSPGHRANILKREFEEVGIAIAEGAPLRGYAGPTVVAIYASR